MPKGNAYAPVGNGAMPGGVEIGTASNMEPLTPVTWDNLEKLVGGIFRTGKHLRLVVWFISIPVVTVLLCNDGPYGCTEGNSKGQE